jgi:hypothetical protein
MLNSLTLSHKTLHPTKPFNFLKLIAWAGTTFSLTGAGFVALGVFLVGYSLFLVGALFWVSVAIARKDNALLTLHLAFVTIDIIGLINLGLS